MADKNTFEGTTTVGITCKDGVVFASETLVHQYIL